MDVSRGLLDGDRCSFRAVRGSHGVGWLVAAFFFGIGLTLGVAAPSAMAATQAVDGELLMLHEDRDVGSRYVYALQTASELLELRFAAHPAPGLLVAGARVRVTGTRENGVLYVASAGSVQTLSGSVGRVRASAIPANTFGSQLTLVILVNFQDNPTAQPYTIASAQGVMAATSTWDRNNSLQNTWLNGVLDSGQAADVRGWYTIPMNGSDCTYSNIATFAKQKATDAGINVASYRRLIYAFPNNSGCSWWGLGSVGGNPSQDWINGSFALRVVAHEMGHGFGLYHSHSVACSTSGGCVSTEYGDGWDVMGSSSGHLTAFQKERLGWLNYTNGSITTPPITTVQTSGTYQLPPYEAQDGSVKALKILKSTDGATGRKTFYFVEYRAALNSDSGLPVAVLLHTGTEAVSDSSNLWDLDQEGTATDWNLDVGQSYLDSAAGITIALLARDSAGASVSVTFGPLPCLRANPTVTLSPTTQWVRGSTGVYSVSVLNNDNSGCAASAFTLAAAPAGWTAAFAPATLLVAPGASGATALTLTAPAGTSDGFYTVSATATNSAAVQYVGTGSATEACCSGSLAVTVATDSATYTQNSNAAITVNVRFAGQPAAGTSVTVNVVAPGGGTTVLTGTTDSSGRAVLSYRIGPRAATTAPYQVSAGASANGYTGSAAGVTFTVQARR